MRNEVALGTTFPCVTDLLGFIHACPKQSDLPKDAQFSDEKARSFHHGKLHGVKKSWCSESVYSLRQLGKF